MTDRTPDGGLARDTALGLAAAVISAPAALGVAVVLARWLDPASNGQVQAALSLLVVLGVVVQAGWVATSVVRLRRARARPALVVTHALGTVALQAAVAIGVGWLVWVPLQERVLVGAPDGVVWGLWLILPLVVLLGLALLRRCMPPRTWSCYRRCAKGCRWCCSRLRRWSHPVIATRIPGCAEVVADGATGLLVAPRAAACRQAHGRAARRRVAQRSSERLAR